MRKIKNYKELEYNLYKEKQRGRLLDTNRVERGIGKSHLLYNIACLRNCKIIVKTLTQANMFNKKFNTDIYYPITAINSLRGKMFDGVLLEEGLTLEDEKNCKRMFDVIGGYSLNCKGVR